MDNLSKDIFKFLCDIVSIKSLSRNEQEVSARIAKEMHKLNYDSVKVDKYGSVVGKIGNGKNVIVYDAHIDTVDIADIRQWKTDPFKAVHKNGIIYGRGACDDKGCVAAIVYAGALIKKNKLFGDFTLYISASVQEEITTEDAGIEAVIKSMSKKPDCVVICEPTNLAILRGHKGRLGIKITTLGKACHASRPQNGRNAIYMMAPIVEYIEKLNNSYKVTSELGKPVISVTRIDTTNVTANAIPDDCTIHIDRRTIEGETSAKVLKDLKRGIKGKVKINCPKTFSGAWVLPKEHPAIKAAVKTCKEVYGKSPEVFLAPYTTNGSVTMAVKNISTFGFGPGDDSYAHVANEQIRFDSVVKSLKFYTKFPSIFAAQKTGK